MLAPHLDEEPNDVFGLLVPAPNLLKPPDGYGTEVASFFPADGDGFGADPELPRVKDLLTGELGADEGGKVLAGDAFPADILSK